MKDEQFIPAIQSVQSFCRAAGIAPITFWRFRKRGWIESVNVAGRQYVLAEQVLKFTRRAAAGEFSKKHKTPDRANFSMTTAATTK